MNEIDFLVKLAKKGFDKLKNNLSIVLILPAILGGLWQLIELSSISFSFMRFFSVSQVIPDGLLILFILILFILSSGFLYMVYYYTINIYQSEQNKEEEITNRTSDKENLIIASILLVCYILSLACYLFSIKHFLEKLDSLFTLIILFPVGMTIIYLAIAFYIYGNLYCRHQKIWSIIFRNTLWGIPMVVFISCLMFASQFHNMFLMPKDLVNSEILKEKIEKENPNMSFEIAYMNDKYIFLKFYGFVKFGGKNKQELVKVIKFDNLFNNETKGYTFPKGF
ncbi:hypothetical protein [Flavobacterium sp. UBA7682]|uniref:hypothetical protein n=1 Tax=Flavobacterium sp. UBA7682 TaxID=1946560 RepID=UPI0025C21CA1|nr:hypothetical protein [Flavobacterium sp. UBA7682]